MDDGNAVDLHFAKAFDLVNQQLLIAELESFGVSSRSTSFLAVCHGPPTCLQCDNAAFRRRRQGGLTTLTRRSFAGLPLQCMELVCKLGSSYQSILPYEAGSAPLENLIAIYKIFSWGLDLDTSLFFIPAGRPGLRGHPFYRVPVSTFEKNRPFLYQSLNAGTDSPFLFQPPLRSIPPRAY